MIFNLRIISIIKNCFVILFASLLLTSCFFGDNPYDTKKLTKDFWLVWFENKTQKSIICSVDGNIGNAVIEETVFAVGFNNDFIIAKQHPAAKNDSIKKYEITNYYIIDIRNFERGNSKSYDVHILSEEGYAIMRNYLNVPEDLTFTIINH